MDILSQFPLLKFHTIDVEVNLNCFLIVKKKKKRQSSHLRNEQYDRKVTCSSKILYTMFFSESKSPANAYQSRAADYERSVDENTVHASLRQESKPILGRFLST